MAINFIQRPNNAYFTPYGNNVILEFTDSDPCQFANVSIEGNPTKLRIYPSEKGVFYVNLKSFIRANVANVNLLDLPVGNQNTILSARIVIETIRSGQVWNSWSNSFIFTPQSFDFQSNYDPVGITHRYALNAMKVVRFGNLPLFYYSYSDDLKNVEKTTFAPPAVQTVERKETCGKYLKFLTKKGGYNYWLFSNANESVTTSSLGTIYNDFSPIGQNQNPFLESGKDSVNSFSCNSGILQDWENDLVKDIFVSPKVYLHLGNDKWLEVKVTNQNARVSNAKNKLVEYNLTFETPPNNNLTL